MVCALHVDRSDSSACTRTPEWAHFSVYDGLGLPQTHIDFVLENGMDAMAITDHGNCNGYVHAWMKEQELRKAGRSFKYIPGVEMYLHPDLGDWARAKAEADERRKLLKTKGAAFAAAQGNDGVESEADSKTNKFLDPVKRRHHLVVLAKNQVGLQNLFTLVSRGMKEGFYRFPRIDYNMLKEHGEGLVISSACIHPDATLITDRGTLTMRRVVQMVNEGVIIQCLSWDEDAGHACFKPISWGDVTRKNAKLFRVTLANGKALKCTGDHKLYTDKGWVRVDELKSMEPIKVLSIK